MQAVGEVMSLASRIANIFNASSAQHISLTHDDHITEAVGVGGHGKGISAHFKESRRQKQDQTMEEEEEIRPPYLHVWLVIVRVRTKANTDVSR